MHNIFNNVGNVVYLKSDKLYGVITEVNAIDEYVSVIFENGSWKDFDLWDSINELLFVEVMPGYLIEMIPSLRPIYNILKSEKLKDFVDSNAVMKYIMYIKSMCNQNK